MTPEDREKGDNIHREKEKVMEIIAKMAEAIQVLTEWQYRYLHYLEYLGKEEKELDEKAKKENGEIKEKKLLGTNEWPRLKPKRKRKQEGKE